MLSTIIKRIIFHVNHKLTSSNFKTLNKYTISITIMPDSKDNNLLRYTASRSIT